ncbi:MAG: hypothetical protein MMC23_004175 [Stictis urceolatum]|nr:hypothetical protein [Stictis urceolata]
MSSTPQTTTPASKGPVEIREIKGQVAADVEQIDTEKRTEKPFEDSLGQSRPSLSRLNPPQHIDMPCSTDSIRPLTAASENTRIEKPPVKPEPIYTRAALSHYDSEKQEYHNQPGLAASFTPTHWSVASPGQPSTTNTEACNCEYVRIQYVPSEQKPPSEDHFGLILVYLSFVSPLVAGLLSLYSLATAVFLSLLAPLSLCTRQQPCQRSFISSISPAVRLQLRIIYAEPVPSTTDSASHLACAAILAPFYAIVIAFAAWVAATFWGYAAILGEPNERAGEEQDGRAAIRAVRRLWENWLLWGLQ